MEVSLSSAVHFILTTLQPKHEPSELRESKIEGNGYSFGRTFKRLEVKVF